MSRATRVEFDGAFYHVMARGVARMPTFLDDADRKHFLEIAGKLVGLDALAVHAFCLMPNHYHLLVSTPHGGLARWMRHVNGDYVRYFNHRHRRMGHLWQGRYKAILVQDGEYLNECSRYIHLNPNRAKITRPAERYKWSSYRNYVGGPKAVPWVETGTVLRDFGGSGEKYRTYVESGKGEKMTNPFERAVAGLVLGGEEFVNLIRGFLKDRKQTEDQPGLRGIRRAPKRTPEDVEAAVEAVFSESGPARRKRICLYALRLHSDLRPSEIARRHGRTTGTVSLAARHLEAESARNAEFSGKLQVLAGRLEHKIKN